MCVWVFLSGAAEARFYLSVKLNFSFTFLGKSGELRVEAVQSEEEFNMIRRSYGIWAGELLASRAYVGARGPRWIKVEPLDDRTHAHSAEKNKIGLSFPKMVLEFFMDLENLKPADLCAGCVSTLF